jgi:hypothetical protein
LDPSAGSCEVIPRGLTDTHLATTDGYWDGNANFKYAKALYRFSFHNFKGTDAKFAEIAISVRDTLTEINNATTIAYGFARSSLAVNLILLQTVVLSVTIDGTVQQFSFVATPGVIYNRKTISFITIATTENVCDYSAHVYVDKISSMASIPINVATSEDVYDCGLTGFFENLGYNQYFDGDTFNLQVDMKSFVVAVAVNLGMREIADLDRLTTSVVSETIAFDGVDYEIRSYVDGHQAGMDPIICMFRSADELFIICGLLVGYMPAIPFANHLGGPMATWYPEFCDCNSDVGKSESCDSMYLSNSLYIPTTRDDSYEYLRNVIYWALAYQEYYGSDFYGYMMYNAYSVNWLTVNLQDSRNEIAQQFCGFNCTLLAMAVGDYNSYINEYGFLLTNGSCSDEVFTTTNWDALQAPPVSLVEDYVQCVNTPGDAIFNALGISTGNASLALQLFGMVVLPMLFGMFWVSLLVNSAL